MSNKPILLVFLSMLAASCAQKSINMSDLRSGERKVTATDGHAYTLSQTNLTDIWGPLVTITLNKPIDVVELPPVRIDKFLRDISIEECKSIHRKPSVKNIISDSTPRIHRYTHKGHERVAWGYVFHCVQ